MLLRVLDRNFLQLGHGTLNVKLGTARARVSPGEQGALPVLEEVEIEGLAKTQTEDLQVGVGWASALGVSEHAPSQTDAPSACTERIALPVSFEAHADLLEDHGALARALGPDDQVVTSLFLSPEDGIDEFLLAANNVARLRGLC